MNPIRQRIVWAVAIGLLSCNRTTATPDDSAPIGRPDAEAVSRGTLWYHLSLGDRLDAALRLYSPPPRTRFFLPGEWAGRTDYADAIGITGASTPKGPTDVAIDRSAGTVDIDSTDAEWVQLEYRVELAARSGFHAQLEEGVLVAFGPTFVVTPAQQILQRTRDIPIELAVPGDFDVISTWTNHGSAPAAGDSARTVHRFIAEDGFELRDAFVVAGPTLRTVRTGADDTLVEVAFSPAFEGDTAEFSELVSSVTERYRDRFGNAGGVRVYVRTTTSVAGEFGGVGRRGGFILDVAPDTAVSDETRLLVAHEALHVWNGHLLMPAHDFEVATRWFKEGVTHYLALRSLPELSESFVLRELSTIAANYARNPITRGQSGRPIDVARHPYDFGVLIALAVDGELARASAGKIDASCWLEQLLVEPQTRYDEQTLFQALQRCASPDGGRAIAQLWRRWVRVREPIELRDLFAKVGLHWLPESGQREPRLIPLDDRDPLYRTLFSLEDP